MEISGHLGLKKDYGPAQGKQNSTGFKSSGGGQRLKGLGFRVSGLLQHLLELLPEALVIVLSEGVEIEADGSGETLDHGLRSALSLLGQARRGLG